MISAFASKKPNFYFPSPLYAIVDPDILGSRPFVSVVEEMLSGGAAIMQLRVKNRPADEFSDLAAAARERTARADCLLIINDRVDISLACGADGVHLGQTDIPLAAARTLLRDKIIGISTHDLLQAQEAERGGADYIGFGPMFGTRTKETGYNARGLAMLAEVRKAVRVPIVAIGGIGLENVETVWKQGAAAAIISDLMKGDSVAERVNAIIARYKQDPELHPSIRAR